MTGSGGSVRHEAPGDLITAVEEHELTFSVDSRLLEELGERLVGKPSAALAELVKNSYDADATLVEIAIDLEEEGRISVTDNGHGMTPVEFRDLWMRVGSQHKRDQRVSRHFGRPFTGSKGVGRIAAQVLSRDLRIITVAKGDPKSRVLAHLRWQEAIQTGDLVDVVVNVREERLSAPQPQGTMILLEGLRHSWSAESIQELATEIWQLQPPFAQLVSGASSDFEVQLSVSDEPLRDVFRDQMSAILRLWSAKAIGEASEGKGVMSLQFRGNRPETFEHPLTFQHLSEARFELRFYELEGRQPSGIRVQDARDYLKKFGGVHIYDTGFRLPFYGEKDNDWLLISYDMSRRVTVSDLLPRDIQAPRMMLSLPQWSQVLGVVEIRTAMEPELEVTITRDRLVESEGLRELRDFVRKAIHWYANQKATQRIASEIAAAPPSSAPATEDFYERLREAQPLLPSKLAASLEEAFESTVEANHQAVDAAQRRASALASFATAGIAAVGYHHELVKQFVLLDRLADRLPAVFGEDAGNGESLEAIQEDLRSLVTRSREIGRIFSHLFEPENMELVVSLSANATVESIQRQVSALQPNVRFDLAAIGDIRLPGATYAEWVSIFQNAFFNALNAMIETDEPLIRVRSETEDELLRILIEDTGVGVDLAKAEDLFEPFVRRLNLPPERKEMGFGGSGLGLTIIRMIAENRGMSAYFKEPPSGFSTSLALEWTAGIKGD